jgi:putative tricarboxylic transport membrane protein
MIIDFEALAGSMTLLSNGMDAWFWVVPGLLIGLVLGALPGISITMAMALCLPLSLYMDFFPAMVFLTSVYSGAGFGGSIPAVLINVPGTTAAVATTFDGYPMARKGQHNEALGAALGSAMIAGMLSYIVLFFLIVPMSELVIRMGPLEMLSVAIWGLLMIGSLSDGSMARGLLAGCIGVLIGTIGMNTAGYIRGTMGVPELIDGVPDVPALLGLLAASQLFGLVNSKFIVREGDTRALNGRAIFNGFMEVFKHRAVLLRGTVIGILIGAAPGVGSSVSNLLSYAEAKRTSKDPESFGTGNVEGVIAAESANNSGEGGSMATMLALGIPGGGATAVLLAAFAMHNIVVGPAFVDTRMDMVYAIIINNLVQCLVLIPVGFGFIYVASSIVRVPLSYLIPVIFVLATFGAFAIDGTMSGPITLAIFSVIGWVLARYKYPAPAVVIGLLLGSMMEDETLKTFQLSNGNPWYFLERPGAMVLMTLILASFAASIWAKRKHYV